MVRLSPVFRIVSVGVSKVISPRETPMPMPLPICPCGPGVRPVPNWKLPRLLIAAPAMMFSDAVSSMKCSGATMATLPALISASLVTPRAPPKWSPWLWL